MPVPSSIADFASANLWVSAFAELLGTAMLVMFACGTALTANGDVTRVALCFGFSVASIVWAIGRVSGGHINPGITWGLLVARRISVARALVYVVAQTVGGVIGAVVLLGFMPKSDRSQLAPCTPVPAAGVSELQAFGIELLIMFVLVLVVCSSVDSRRADLGGSVPLTVGVVIAMGHFLAIPFTGAGMNPARAFGPAAVSQTWRGHWAFWVGPFVGGALAAVFYEFLLAVDAKPGKLRRYFASDYDPDDADVGEVTPCFPKDQT